MPLSEAPALARRNPVLVGQPLQLTPPVATALKVPVVLAYCPDGADTYNSQVFMDYQQFVLEIPAQQTRRVFRDWAGRPLPPGFRPRAGAKFGAGARHRRKAAGFIFHRRDQRTSLEQNPPDPPNNRRTLGRENQRRSVAAVPRLVGAFVYDSQSGESRDLMVDDKILWCPRQEAAGTIPTATSGRRTARPNPALKFRLGR